MIKGLGKKFESVIDTLLSWDFRNKEKTKINVHADTVRWYFEGYPFVCVIANSISSDAWALRQVMEWCTENCDEWNHGYFRVSELINGDWVFNDITGYDVSFWTFTNEADATMFALKWK